MCCFHCTRPAQAIGQEKYELPVPLIRSAHQHLVAARDEAARTAKELAELKASRVQHIPPSTWIKREQKYKMDQEKYEHIISQLRQRSEALERELAVLREGSNVRPLEEKIQVRVCLQCIHTSCMCMPVVLSTHGMTI